MTQRALFLLPLLAVIAIATACNGGNGSGSPTSTSPGGNGGNTPGSGDGNGGNGAVTLNFTLEPMLTGFRRPVFVTGSGIEGDARLFVVEKGGLIRIVEDGEIIDDPFLDVSDIITAQGNEQGLLGLAFHPDYENNGRFFIAYTADSAGAGDNTVAEYAVSASDPNQADPGSATVLLAIEDFAANHNGGMLAFGPDGYLYFGTGDGGQGGDPRDNGQNTEALLGKMLRLDVDNREGGPYGIPESNPFVDGGGAPEVWAYGLRNPWRFSFDRQTGDLYIADVGQNRHEEVNFQPADSAGGENYGWNIVEGPECFIDDNCDKSGFVEPVATYDHSNGCSITGGYVYRGATYPEIAGGYFYADYCSGQVWMMTRDASGEFSTSVVIQGIRSITSFGQDNAGELYAVDDGGNLRSLSVQRIVTTSAPKTEKDPVKLTLESPDFGNGRSLPAVYTCDGEGTSPQITWDQTPAGTRSFVILFDDTSVDEEIQSQWMLFNIPPVGFQIGANVPEGPQIGAGPIQQGKTASGKMGYSAPCPEDGKKHDYRYSIYALNTTLPLAGGATRAEVVQAMEGHILGQGELETSYTRQ